MPSTLRDVVEVLQENNEMQEFLTLENYTMLETINNTLLDIRGTLNSFFNEYQESIIRQLEQQAEAATPTLDMGGEAPVTTPEQADTIGIPLLGLLTSVAALSKMFDVDEIVRFPATVALFSDKIKDFVKSIRSFGTRMGNFFKPVLKVLDDVFGAVGRFLAPLGALVKKIALPITIIFSIIDGISGFAKSYGETGSIVEGFKGAVTEIVDSLVGGLIRVISSGIEWLLSQLGFEDAAQSLGNVTDKLVEIINRSVGNIYDIIAGILTFDDKRIMAGITDIGQMLADFFQGIVETISDYLPDFLKPETPQAERQRLTEEINTLQQQAAAAPSEDELNIFERAITTTREEYQRQIIEKQTELNQIGNRPTNVDEFTGVESTAPLATPLRAPVVVAAQTVDEFSDITTPAPIPVLASPIGQTSQEVSAAASGPIVVAPQTTVAPINNQSSVTNINNATTIGSTGARPTEPSFMRMQNQLAPSF